MAALHGLTDLETGVTVNVGTVRGGERPNVVAAHAAADIDLRAWSQADADATIAAMRTICERPHVAGTRARFQGQIHFPPWPPGLPGTERLLEIMRGAGRELGVEVRAIKTGAAGRQSHLGHHAHPRRHGAEGQPGAQRRGVHRGGHAAQRTKMIALFVDRWAAEFEIPAR